MQRDMCWSLSLLALLRNLLGFLALGGAFNHPELAERPAGTGASAAAQSSESDQLEVPASHVRCEWFQVRRVSDPEADPVAVVRLLRLDAADHTLLERDVVWRVEGWRLHHTERLAGRARRLTWRELGPGGALAWTADWDLADRTGGRSTNIVGYGWARPTHERTLAGAPWIGALEWLEAARAGALAELGPVAWLTPTRASSGTPRTAADAAPVTRWPFVTAHAMGPEGRATFAGGAIESFELGSRDLRATPIAEVEYQRLVGLWTWRQAARHPYVEAALHRGETLRRLAELGDSAVYERQ